MIPCDVTKENSIQKLYNKSKKLGFVENIVNNAGFGKFSKISDIDIPFWRVVFIMVKWAIASIPAIIILMILFAIFGGFFVSIISMFN